MIKKLSTNSSKYMMLRRAGYNEKVIPSWVARPGMDLMDNLNRGAAVEQTEESGVRNGAEGAVSAESTAESAESTAE
jgi:hypothetical protein